MSRLDPRTWGVNQKLAALALVLGAGATLGAPSPGGAVRLDTRELARIVEGEVDHVTVDELADWIVQDRADYRLIDIRSSDAYAAYHIPTAEHAAIRDLRDYPLYRNEKIVLYSDGGIHSAQAWFLLQAEGFRGSYILLGGLNAWKEDILFPALRSNATPEDVADFERRRQISQRFGGAPRSDGDRASEPSEVSLPKMPPPAPAAAPRQRRKMQRKEGC